MTEEQFEQVAERFRVLGEPARLRILSALREGEATVGELVDRTGLNQANLSKHLQILHATGFVVRRKEGLFVHYALADEDVFLLCDVMCGRLERAAAGAPARRARPGTRRRAG
ncbi:MAG TPA: metalloregulator ArsR/SmtB family transcription factor [Vicinamibacterales bacterium]